MSGKTEAMIVRAWRDHDALLVRVLEARPFAGPPREFVCTTIDEACDVISGLLRELCADTEPEHPPLTRMHTQFETNCDTQPETTGDTGIPNSGDRRDHTEEP
jgi:hypothetical protein